MGHLWTSTWLHHACLLCFHPVSNNNINKAFILPKKNKDKLGALLGMSLLFLALSFASFSGRKTKNSPPCQTENKRRWLHLFCTAGCQQLAILTACPFAAGLKGTIKKIYDGTTIHTSKLRGYPNTMTSSPKLLAVQTCYQALCLQQQANRCTFAYIHHAFLFFIYSFADNCWCLLCLRDPDCSGVDIAVFVVWARFGLECDPLSSGNAAKPAGLGKRKELYSRWVLLLFPVWGSWPFILSDVESFCAS